MENHNFQIDLIDFRVKRLGLTHDPRIQGTIKARGTINSFGRALVAMRKSFIPDALKKKTA